MNLIHGEPAIQQASLSSVESSETMLGANSAIPTTNGSTPTINGSTPTNNDAASTANSAVPNSPLFNVAVHSEEIARRPLSVVKINDSRLTQSHSRMDRVIPFCLGSKPVRLDAGNINWEQCRTEAAEAEVTSGLEADSVYIDIDQAYFTAHPTQIIFSDSVSSCILVCARILDDQGKLWRGIAHISPDPISTHAFDEFVAGIRNIPSRHTDIFLMGGLHDKGIYQDVAAWVKKNGMAIGYNSRHNPLNITKEQEDDIYHEAYFNLMIKHDGQIGWEGII